MKKLKTILHILTLPLYFLKGLGRAAAKAYCLGMFWRMPSYVLRTTINHMVALRLTTYELEDS